MPINLDASGLLLLEYLIRIAPSADPKTLSGFPTYSEVHKALGLQMLGRTWGDSLDRQGMGTLAEWAQDNGYPAVTGFIISGETRQPAAGYFRLYGKDPNADWSWWLSQVAAAKAYSWPRSGIPVPTSSNERKPDQRQDARTLADLALTNSRFFLKSEWGPISDKWPALSFSKRSVGAYLNREYNSTRDFIVYAGTSNPERTEVRGYRQRLLSVLIAEPGEPIATEKLVPWDSWQDARRKHAKDWPFSFGVRAAWDLNDLPRATDVTPVAYRAMGIRSNWGGVVEILGDERESLKSLSVRWVELPNREIMQNTAVQRDRVRELRENPALSGALARLEALVKGRIGPSRTVWKQTPARTLPAGVNLTFLLQDKLTEQNNLCALCGKLMRLDTTKKLLQVSPDRIVSTDLSYGSDNLQITHLACNLAKNDGSAEDFEEWLELVTQSSIGID